MQVSRISSPHFKGIPICSHDFRHPQLQVVQPLQLPFAVLRSFLFLQSAEARAYLRWRNDATRGVYHDKYKRLIWHQGVTGSHRR
jgi:hypothetical protein